MKLLRLKIGNYPLFIIPDFFVRDGFTLLIIIVFY